MDTVYEVLNGSTITTFQQVSAAIIYLSSIIMEGKKAMVVMVTTIMHQGALCVCEEIIEVRHRLFVPEEWE